MRAFPLVGIFILLLAAASTLLGIREMQSFDNTPGGNARASALWPSGTALARPQDKPIVLLFVHPRCSCSKATFKELRKVLARVHVQPEVRVILEPEEEGVADLWQPPADLRGARVLPDAGGLIADRFGAQTSGVIKLYDASGHLRFDGGITAARGHEGDNPGSEALENALNGAAAGGPTFRVFGCALKGVRSL